MIALMSLAELGDRLTWTTVLVIVGFALGAAFLR